MIIERDYEMDSEYENNYGYPDLFITSANIENKSYVKYITDYFSNKAIRDVKINIDTFGRNYRFFEGEIDSRDFYEASLDHETDNFIMDVTEGKAELPEYVRLYSILNQPINALAGEIAESPDDRIVRAYDADSLNEILNSKTEIIEEFISSKITTIMYEQAEKKGLDMEDQQVVSQVQEMTEEELEEQLSSITTLAEKWANRKLQDLKANIGYEDIEEEAIYDLLKTGRATLHIYEDNSSQGFNAETIRPTLVSTSLMKGKKYYKDSYHNSIVRVMEISEIIERFRLNKEEIDHIKQYKENVNSKLQDYHDTRLGRTTGINSITYAPPTMFNEDQYMQSLIEEEMCGSDDLGDIFRYLDISVDLGNYAMVVENYILCKELIGELTFLDEEGDEMTIPITDEYKEGSHPGEIEVNWGYVNRWFKTTKIGSEVYKMEPINYMDSSPILGITVGKGLLDMLKDRQIIYSLCINQLWELLQKELGVVFSFDWTQIPVGKEEEYEDALESWLVKAEELGIAFKDNDPEKFKIRQGQQEVAKAIDLTRGAEMRARIELAAAIKEEAYEMVGVSRSRLGSNLASETATSVNNSRKSSYSQTIHWYNAHKYVFDQFYQGLIDAAQYYESQQEETTVIFSSTDGERSMLQVLGSEISMRDLRVYLTSDPKDLNDLAMAKELGMSMIQNGTDPYVVSKVLFSKSIREIQETFKKERAKNDKGYQEGMEMQNKELHTQYAIETMKEKSRKDEVEKKMAYDSKERQLDRISEEKRAAIRAYGFREEVLEDVDDSGTADVLEVLDRQGEIDETYQKYEQDLLESNTKLISEQNKIASTQNENRNKDALTKKELELKEKQMKIQERKAKTDERKVEQQIEVAKYYDKGQKEK